MKGHYIPANHLWPVTYSHLLLYQCHYNYLPVFTLYIFGSMLRYFISRVPLTSRLEVSLSPLRPNYSRMIHAVPQAVTNTCHPEPSYRSLALSPSEDSTEIRQKYRPFILTNHATEDWVEKLDLTTAADMAEQNLRATNERLKVLVLYGSLRRRSYSRLVALEASRILFRLGCDVRVFDPEGLPMKNETDVNHPKVQELRELSLWSDGHVWVSPEQHGNLVRSFPRTD